MPAAARNVNIQTLGEELATGAGSSVQRNRFLLLLLSTAFAGIAVAFAGTVGFVGLMAPHIARRLVGSSSTFRLVLIGIGFSMLAQSLTTLFMIKGPIYRMSQANVWITGSVYGSNWQDVNVLLPAALVLLLISAIRNPLASPDIIGVTGGASVAVVLFLMLFSDKNNALTVSISWLPVAAFVGAALAGMLVYFLSYKNGSLTACAVVLSAGIGERFISPGAVAKTFLGMGDPGDDLIIMSFRMPRILVALFAGICLAAAGSILQGLWRKVPDHA
ncbi:hypothetical protein DT075_11710 [Bacillus licheniformis]|nr:hypothetical protein DT075_11710 [Bacillus licheniformis]